jgi:periplasmic protein TonB
LETSNIIIFEPNKKKAFPSMGWLVSLLLHALLLAIPISLVVQTRYKDVEMFVVPEVPFREDKKPTIKASIKKTVPRPPDISVQLRPAPTIPVVSKATDPPPTILEPTALSESPVVMPVQAMPASPVKGSDHKGGQGEQVLTGAQKQEGPLETGFGEGDSPRFLYREVPEYPPLARRWGKEGKVILRLSINEKGELIKVEVVAGQNFGLTEAAVQAVKKSTFIPARYQGKPVACRAVLPILFVLRREG